MRRDIGVIYRVINKANGKIYIGSSINPKYRWNHHKWVAKSGGGYRFHKAIRKHGIENFEFEIIASCLDNEKLFELEQTFIDKYDSTNFEKGYNSMGTGDMSRIQIQQSLSNSWKDPEKRAARISAMEDNAAHRARPLIAISRFDLSILEFPSVNAMIKDGRFTWGSVHQSLIRTCAHAYDHCWFYKEEGKSTEQYIEEAKAILGSKFSSVNITPFTATHITSGATLSFSCLKDLESTSFEIKAVRQVLTGRRKSYKGFAWALNK